MRKVIFAFPLGAVIIFASCSAPQDDIVALQREVINVKRDVNTLKREQAEMKKKIDQLSSRVDRISQMASQNALEIQKLKTKMRELEKRPAQKSSVKKTKYSERKGLIKGELSDVELYEMALRAYNKQDYDEARRLLARLVSEYPNSKYYDNALFWIGQTFYMEGNYERAIKFFDKIIRECENGTAPDCNKLPMAMLKKAYALVNMGRKREAMMLLNKIIHRYPDDEVSEFAKKKLESLHR